MKLKYIKHLALGIALALALSATAFASPVPDNLVVENLNGQQRRVKTYALPQIGRASCRERVANGV